MFGNSRITDLLLLCLLQRNCPLEEGSFLEEQCLYVEVLSFVVCIHNTIESVRTWILKMAGKYFYFEFGIR
jgi:hypothetical protein